MSGATSPLLIVNGDDYGLTPGVCEGILRAHERGILTSTSALAIAPAFRSWAPALRDSGMGVGVHLALVGEDPPLLPASEVPTLVDRRGRLPASWRRFLPRAAAGLVDSDDVRRELAAQVEAVRSEGFAITHLDSHQHLHLWPSVARVVLDLCDTFGIPSIRVPRSHGPQPKRWAFGALANRLENAARRRRLRFPGRFLGHDHAGHVDTATLHALVESASDGTATSTEIGLHPGAADDPDRDRYRWGYRWADEVEALCAPSTRRLVEARGLRLGTFADLGGAS